MTPSEVTAIIARGEDSRHQFKRDFTNAESMAAELAAFANMGGGLLLVGVCDDGSTAGLTTADIGRLNQILSNAASQHVKPPVNPLSTNVQTGQGLVMVIDMPEGLNKPYVDANGRIWVKTGADKRQVTAREEMQRMFQQSGLLQADEQAVTTASLSNIDQAAFPGTVLHSHQYLDSETIEGTLAQQYQHCMAFLGRNPALASHAFHILPYHGMGSGIIRALKDWPHIEFTDDRKGNQFRVTLKRDQLPDGGVSVGVNVGVNELLDIIRMHPGLPAPDIAKHLGLTSKNIERWLKQLKADGKVEFKGPPKTGGYHCV